MRAANADLENTKPTPFNLILSIYGAKLAGRMPGWEQMDLLKQCQYLYLERLDSKAKRKEQIDKLINNEEFFSHLRSRAYLRIHMKYALKLYCRESHRLTQDLNVANWTHHEIIVSFIFHLINLAREEDTKKAAGHAKVWEFADYLRKYFIDTNYNGHTFLDSFGSSKTGQKSGAGNNNSKPTKGYGLMMMKTVCSKYGLKSGPFSKVKKQCNIWAQHIHAQSQGTIIHPTIIVDYDKQYDFDDPIWTMLDHNIHTSKLKMPKNIPPSHYKKFVTEVPDHWTIPSQDKPNNNNSQKKNNENTNVHMGNKKWYWFNDSGGFKWIPYRQIDVNKLNSSWANNEKSCLILNGDYRVDFDYSNKSAPAGNQYSTKVQNPGGRTVVCSDAKDNIHGIPIASQPM
mmetsp:Transcript_68538/g.61576  ORF Transcript_68538/g.61576 Transcript_68538/m.61576 type:complete len:399 (+) Transcript_68538:62-1258(+)